MLGTLLEVGPPGRRWPSFSDTRSLITGGLRVRGLVWLLSMLWVALGAGGAIYAIVTFIYHGYSQDFRWMIQWYGEPQVLVDVAAIALPIWFLMSGPLVIAGFVRLRGWRLGNWLRVARWVAMWVAGLALMNQEADLASAGEGATHGFLSVGALAVCAGWLVLGGLMTWILAVPFRRSDVADTDDSELRQASA